MTTKDFAPMPRAKRVSRAVIRDVEAGTSVNCAHCGERVKFQAKMHNKQVICNVYVKGVWKRVEHFHLQCYIEAEQPHGEPVPSADLRKQAAYEAAIARGRKLVQEREEERDSNLENGSRVSRKRRTVAA